MFYETIKDLSNGVFRRLVGVKRSTFEFMLKILSVQYAVDHELGGAPSKLTLEDKLLMTLCYWRGYRTYLHLGVSESQAFKIVRWVEDTLIKSGSLTVPGKSKLYELDKQAVILMDVTESPIERPQKKAT
jgi:Helix-turn-helix of DDE superfamily endonuclease